MDFGTSGPRQVVCATMIDVATVGVNIIAQQATTFDTSSITTQPARPRAARCVFASTWNGGNIEITGYDVAGDPAIEVVTAVGVGTVEGKIPWSRITRLRCLGTRTTGTVDIQTGLGLGLPCKRGQMIGLARTSVNNAYEANGTVDVVNSTVQPTTAPNGTNDYEFWVIQRVSVKD